MASLPGAASDTLDGGCDLAGVRRRRWLGTASPGISTVEDDRSVTGRTDEPHAIPHVRHVLSRGNWPLIEHDFATRTQEFGTSVERLGEASLFLVGESVGDGHGRLPHSARSVYVEEHPRRYYIARPGGLPTCTGSPTRETWSPRTA